jgi:GT2 family glycosyltransferase
MNSIITIIVVNYNGASDTIDCLESIYSSDISSKLKVILIDNLSVDSSVEDIKTWLTNNRYRRSGNYEFGQIVDGQVIDLKCDDFTDVFLQSDDNYGFAVANNLEENDIDAVIPQIRLFFDPEKIWNCGGELTWFGTKRYHYANKNFNIVNNNIAMRVSFFTGCAVLFKSEVFKNVGLLSEDYFFGTEDLNYSQRLAQSDIKVYCLMKSIIYHKVGQSIGRENLSFSILNHYLGHYINQRQRSPLVFWIFWMLLYNIYIFIMIIYRYQLGFGKNIKLIFFLTKYSFVFSNVRKDHFIYLKNKLR